MKSRYFDQCADESTKLTLPFGRFRYHGGEVQRCAWEFALPEDNRDYVFLMHIPYLLLRDEDNVVTLPNNGKNTFIFFPYLYYLALCRLLIKLMLFLNEHNCSAVDLILPKFPP